MSKRYGGPEATYGLDSANGGIAGRSEAAADHAHHGADESNDHLASIYRDREDQLATVVPFLKHGLEQGERCLYVADENSPEDILEALRADDVDVDAARESGALSILTKDDTYLRTGEFEADAMLDFWEETLADARDDRGFAGVRAAAEMTWALDEGTGLDQLVQYESLLNTIYPGEDYVVLCQYNRDRFPSDVLSDVIRSHPLVVYDGTVCRNFYYRPPEEFFGTDHPPLDVDRSVEGLRQHAETRRELESRDRFQSRLYEITSDPERSFDEKVQALFDLGCAYFGMELGAMARVDPAADHFVVERTSGDHEHFEPGLELELSDTYCTAVTNGGSTAGVSDPASDGFADITVHRDFGIRAYLGTRLEIENGHDRTFFFLSSDPRDEPFTDGEKTSLHLMGQWVEQELERQRYEDRLEASNERLEQFAYAASHDLQEPLRMVSSYLELIENRYGDQLDSDGEEFIEYAVDGADRMRAMIQGLLKYSRVETRGDPIEPIDLAAVVDDVLTDLQLRIDESDADVTVEDLPRVAGDPDQLREVVQNLVENAIQYSGESSPRIEITGERAGDDWVISVRDDGIGIDPEDHERIFEVFQRLHTRDEHGGTGIGLALCQRIVERHGGEIWVESEPGEGSTFSFTLPAVDGRRES